MNSPKFNHKNEIDGLSLLKFLENQGLEKDKLEELIKDLIKKHDEKE